MGLIRGRGEAKGLWIKGQKCVFAGGVAIAADSKTPFLS